MTPPDLPPASRPPVAPRATFAPTPPTERRARRDEVERRLVNGESAARVRREVAELYRVSTRVVQDDVRRVEQRWAREDAADLARERRNVVRRLRRVALAAEAAGDLKTAARANADLGRLVGLGIGGGVNVAVAVTGAVPDPSTVAPRPSVDDLAAALRVLEAGAPRAVPPQVGTPAVVVTDDAVPVPVPPSRALPPPRPGCRFPWDIPDEPVEGRFE